MLSIQTHSPCIPMHTPTHSRDCSRVDLICKQIIKLIARRISIERPNPCGFVPLLCLSQLSESKSNVPVMTPSPIWTVARFHLISSQVQSGFGLNWELHGGKVKDHPPRLCCLSPPPLFLITSPKPPSLLWVWQFSFRVHSLLTLNISLRVFGRLWG